MAISPLPDVGPEIRILDPERTPEWREMVLAHWLRLDPDARRLRFFGAMADSALCTLAARSRPLQLVVHVPDGRVRGCAEVHPGDIRGTAEIAVSVEADWQNRGVGAMLTATAHAAATAAGFDDVRMVCLRRNTAMMRVARKLSAHALPLADWALALFRLKTLEAP